MTRSTLSLLFVLPFVAALLFSAGCDTAECEEDANQCDGDQIQACHDGVWEDPEDCEDAMEACMVMDDGTEHCMASM